MQEENEEKNDKIYEKVACALEEKCQERRAREFYKKLQKNPVFCKYLTEIAGRKKEKNIAYQKVNIDLGHMQTRALDFFHALDEELCESVWRVLEDTQNTTLFVKKPSEKGGNNSVAVVTHVKKWKNSPRTLKKVKIEISLAPRNDALGLCTVAHELAHTMEERVQKRIMQKVPAISEIVPMFLERIYADYLAQTGVIEKSERDKVFADIQNCFIDNAKTIVLENYILSQLPSPIQAKDLKALDEKYAGLPEHKKLLKRIKIMVDGFDGKEHYGEKQFKYVVGEIVSGELYKDFQKEPARTIERLKKFAQNNAHISARQGFEMLLGEDYETRLSMIYGKGKK